MWLSRNIPAPAAVEQRLEQIGELSVATTYPGRWDPASGRWLPVPHVCGMGSAIAHFYDEIFQRRPAHLT